MGATFKVFTCKPKGQEHPCRGEEAVCDATGSGLTPLSAPSYKPPYWDSASLHSLLQGRQQWQIKLLVLFCGVGVGSTATWQKWWCRILKGTAFALSLWCHVCKASSNDEKSWNQRQCIKFCLCNHLQKKSITTAFKCTTLYCCPLALPCCCCCRMSCACTWREAGVH